MARISGTVTFTIDGESFDLTGSVGVPMNTTTKEPIIALNGNVHYKETPIAPFVTCTFLVTEDFPIEKLQTGTDMTVTAVFANGKSYTLSGAFLDGDPEYDSDGGTVDM